MPHGSPDRRNDRFAANEVAPVLGAATPPGEDGVKAAMRVPHSPRSVMIAVGMMLVACALVAATTLFAKMLGRAPEGQAIHPLQVTAGRFIFALVALAPVMALARPSLAGIPWGLHGMRVVSGWIGVSCLFMAATLMRLSDATAISFLNPIVAMVLAIPFLGEKVGPWRWSAATIAFLGVVVLAQPGGDTLQAAAFIALAAALFMGGEAVLVKKLSDIEPTMRILLVGNVLGGALSLVAASFVWRSPTPEQWALLAGVGFAMVGAQALFLQALRRGDASFIVPFFYTTLIFATLYDFAVFGERPPLTSYVGAGLIIAGALVIAWRERARR